LRYPRGGYLIKPYINTLPVHNARIRDDRTLTTRFLHDVGAGVCLMLSKEFIDDSAILRKSRRLWPKEGEGVGGTISMNMTVVKELKLGPYRFRNVPTYVFNDDYNVTSYPYLAGLIGNDLLRRFNVIFNYQKKDIHLVPNSHFREPFDYSYSGIELYFLEGRIEVGSVAVGSPADEAGLQVGDIVVSINNNFSQNFNQYKMALQAPGEKLKMILRRNGQLVQINLKIRSIL
jgi:hypothetical protein